MARYWVPGVPAERMDELEAEELVDELEAEELDDEPEVLCDRAGSIS